MSRFQTWYHALPKAIRRLLTINVVIYLLWIFLALIPFARTFVFNHVALTPATPDILFEPWQLVTYNFLHLGSFENPGLSLSSLIHIGFNMAWMVWIGRDHEDLRGAHHLMALYLITGVGGGLLSVVWHGILPAAGLGGDATAPVIHGASASVLGIITAVVTMYPRKRIHLLFIGSVPLLLLLVVYLAYNLLSTGHGMAVAAHLGGALFGFLFVKIEDKGIDLSSWTRIVFREPRRRRQTRQPAQSGSFLGRLEARLASRHTEKERAAPRSTSTKKAGKSPMAKIRALHTTEKPPVVIENEVDRILDKISEQGMESLTEEEKRLLEEASRR